MLEDEEITTWKVWISTGKTRTSTGEQKHRPESGNIGGGGEHRPESRNINRRAETSAGKRKHRPESRNIGRKAETSTGEQKHRPESGNIDRRAETSAGDRKHQPENAKYRRLERFFRYKVKKYKNPLYKNRLSVYNKIRRFATRFYFNR
ncbi:hypothetical protein [Virgibacillus dakarensis]|uniref:hypothetical protein n=1 Tax=Virgibacillus dakarensis TaxID=1917889 RepID=UPI000B43C308|nr:hypothetical protein [Virgibacillus dakarensis]